MSQLGGRRRILTAAYGVSGGTSYYGAGDGEVDRPDGISKTVPTE